MIFQEIARGLELEIVANLLGDPGVFIENLVYLELDVNDPFEISEKLNQKGIKAGPYHSDTRWRLVPHYGLTTNDIDYFIDSLNRLIN